MKKINKDDEIARAIWLNGIRMVQRLTNLDHGREFAEDHLLDVIYYLKRLDVARNANAEAGYQKYNLYKRAMPLSSRLLYIEQLFAQGIIAEQKTPLHSSAWKLLTNFLQANKQRQLWQ